MPRNFNNSSCGGAETEQFSRASLPFWHLMFHSCNRAPLDPDAPTPRQPERLPLPPCSLCWSSIILLLLPYPLLAPLCPPVCCTLGHYHLVRLTGFGEGDGGGPSGGTPALKAPFCIDRPAVDLFVIIEHTCRCRRGRRLAQSISFFSGWAFDLETHTLCCCVIDNTWTLLSGVI